MLFFAITLKMTTFASDNKNDFNAIRPMSRESDYRLPAEWEAQSGVQLTWPHRATDWAPMLDDVLTVYKALAREISLREPLLVVAPEGGAPGMVHVTCPTNDTWARDHAFITLTGAAQPPGGHGQAADCKLLDFCFNGWGEKFASGLDNAINRRLYDIGAVRGQYVSHLDFVLEGGSIESDGRGTIFTTSSCLLAPHRNQPLGRDDIAERLCSWLGADRVVWIDHGQLAGDDTDGHIDTLVRVAPGDTLLYIKSDDPADEHYVELQLMEEQLHTLRTTDGRPYRLLPLPLPHPICDDEGQRLPATHANFLVINGAVLCPTYGQPDRDEEALSVIAQAFPGRDIVPIDCRVLIRQHGSLHCCTMQFPLGAIAD